MSKKKTINAQDFNLWVTNILALYSEFLEVPKEEIAKKINLFNNQLENQIKQHDEKSVQLGQDDQTSEQFI